MLRRKLLTRIGLLIVAFVAGAVVAIWFLQDALAAIDRANRDASVLISGVQTLNAGVATIDSAWARAETEDPRPVVADTTRRIREAMTAIDAHPITRSGGAAAEAHAKVRTLLAEYLAREQGPSRAPEALAATVDLHTAIDDAARQFRSFVEAEQAYVSRYFRAMVLALTLAALVMVNVAVIVLVRAAQMVLRPVGALVEGSRELAAERFDHRVHIEQQDEFGELAHAYNHLAEQLQANEQRKTETLRQLAVTLNHDLNNAMSVIELQLGLLGRQTHGNPTLDRHLREIRGSLARMTDTVASLKNIRRVVLTDYAPGQKMIDLERSVRDDDTRIPGRTDTSGTPIA